MSKTILADVDGWTPLIDDLVQTHGVVGAAVFGRIWRYCQMDNQVCSVPLSRIADDLSIDKSTVMRYAARLCEDGYLRDTTPNAGNRPHVYADTGKASLGVSLKARTSDSPRHQPKRNNAAQCNVALNNVAENNTSVALNNESVAQNNAHIRKIRDNKETTKKAAEAERAREAPDEVLAQDLAAAAAVDDAFINWLQGTAAYCKKNVWTVYNKLVVQCEIEKVTPTKNRLLSWLKTEWPEQQQIIEGARTDGQPRRSSYETASQRDLRLLRESADLLGFDPTETGNFGPHRNQVAPGLRPPTA